MQRPAGPLLLLCFGHVVLFNTIVDILVVCLSVDELRAHIYCIVEGETISEKGECKRAFVVATRPSNEIRLFPPYLISQTDHVFDRLIKLRCAPDDVRVAPEFNREKVD